jgi:peptide/nickel transport system permease protein
MTSSTETLPPMTARSHYTPRYWRRLIADKVALTALCVLSFIILSAVFAPQLAPQDPVRQALSKRLKPPAWAEGNASNLMGTDQLGRDILSRIIYGARVSLFVGFVAVLFAGVLGVLLGLFTGFYRGWLDDVIARLIDVQLSVPYLLLAIALVMVMGPSLPGLVVVLVLYGWPVYARLVRADVLSVREREYVLAARAVGVGDVRVILRHIMPNVLNPIIITATIEIANMIIFEAGLSFLGLGVQPPTPSWGSMLSDSRDYLPAGIWWPATFPGLAITLTILCINTLGDRLRDVLDPRFVS